MLFNINYNRLINTNRLTAQNIENHSEFEVKSHSSGFSTDMAANAINAMMTVSSLLGNQSDSDSTTTQSAVSHNINLNIKTGEIPTALSRDTENANQKVKQFDIQAIKQEVAENQEMAKVIGDLARLVTRDIVQSHLEEANQKREMAESLKESNRIESDKLLAEAEAIEAKYGVGSDLQRGIRAVTAALQGLATDNVNYAIAGVLSPYANQVIKEMTTNADGSINREANLIAHVVLGGLEAHITGNNAVAGGLGALTAEAVVPYLMQTLYNTDKVENLTDSQKQNIANLSQIVAGLAGGIVGDSTASSISGAEIGRRAVENNHFGDDIHPSEDRRQTIEMLAIAMFKGDLQAAEEYYDKHQEEITKYQLQEYLAIVLTKGIPQIATKSTIVSGALGGGSETIGQLIDNKGDISQIDGVKIGISTVTGIVTKDMGIGKTVLANSGVEILDSYRTGEDPLTKGISSAIVTTTGGIIGKGVEIPLNNKINPNWKNYTLLESSFSNAVSSFYTPSSMPSLSGNIVDNIFTKSLEKRVENEVEQYKGKIK